MQDFCWTVRGCMDFLRRPWLGLRHCVQRLISMPACPRSRKGVSQNGRRPLAGAEKQEKQEKQAARSH